MKSIASNKKAYFDYQILEDWEAGIALLGPEIKAIRAGRATIGGSYVRPFTTKSGKPELWWVGSNFHLEDGDPSRTKKVLLHREEIKRIQGKLASGNLTLVPLELYYKRGRAKLKIGLASHKKKYDKRELLKKRDLDRDLSQQFSRRR